MDIVKNGTNYFAVISMKNIMPFSDGTAIIEIIPISKSDENIYSVEEETKFIELERKVACSDKIKSSRNLIVVSCYERGWIQIFNIATKKMIIEEMLVA